MITGQRGHEQLNSVRVKPEVADKILMYAPEATPFLTLTGRLRDKITVENPLFQWLEKDQYPRMTTSSALYDDDDTSVVVAAGTGSRLRANDIIRVVDSGETFRVTVVSTDTLTVTRAFGGNAAPIALGGKLVVVGSAYEDGAGIGALKSTQDFNKFNYTQIFRWPFGFTGRDLQVALFGGPDEVTETKAATNEHKRSIEYAFFFGRRNLATITHQVTTTGGLDESIVTNAWNVSGTTLNERTFNEFLEQAMRWGNGGYLAKGSAVKFLFHSAHWGTEINDWAGKKLQYRILDDSIGFAAEEYNSPFGKVMLVHTPILDEYFPDKAYLVDPNHVSYVALKGRDSKLLRDRQAPDIDGVSHEYLADVGIKVSFEHAHASLFGLSV
jgi:hypothetical protein